MKIVFLDRDGTVVKEPHDERIDKTDKIELLPDSIEALKYLADNDFGVALITNQAGIGEGRITEDDFWVIHNEILRQLAPSGVEIVKTYMNPEAGGPDATEWRKPGPKMLLQAAEDLSLNLSDIYMVGDSSADIQAGINAGCKGGIYIETERTAGQPAPIDAEFTATNLLDAAKYIVANS